MSPYTVAVLVGSLRKGSFTRRVAGALIKLSPTGLRYDIVEIGDLPLYNQDLDEPGAIPPAWTAFREKIRSSDAVLFATPEYNRSLPGDRVGKRRLVGDFLVYRPHRPNQIRIGAAFYEFKDVGCWSAGIAAGKAHSGVDCSTCHGIIAA